VSRIADYRFGHVTVDGRELTRDVIVLPDRVVENWWRRNGHELVWQDLKEVVDDFPPRLVVGMGADQRMRPDPDTLDRLRGRGIDVECLPTDRAVERFAELDPATTAAALHLTC
jgi:hypothetical protein